jgi:uncharacterized membrane protein
MTTTKPGITDFATVVTTVGVVAVGAAIFEAALIPGIVLGAAAIFAPDLASRRLPGLRRGLRSVVRWPTEQARKATPSPPPPHSVLPRLQVGQALAKTITFRITVATLDFGWNYIFLGEIATAAGLSALNLAVGPVFYFLHEAAWNLVGSTGGQPGSIAILPPEQGGETSPIVQVRGFKVTRAVAKTIIYETFGSTAEFAVNWIAVGDVVTAAIITAPFVIFGPFIYLGHERVWDYFTERADQAEPPALNARGPATHGL